MHPYASKGEALGTLYVEPMEGSRIASGRLAIGGCWNEAAPTFKAITPKWGGPYLVIPSVVPRRGLDPLVSLLALVGDKEAPLRSDQRAFAITNCDNGRFVFGIDGCQRRHVAEIGSFIRNVEKQTHRLVGHLVTVKIAHRESVHRLAPTVKYADLVGLSDHLKSDVLCRRKQA